MGELIKVEQSAYTNDIVDSYASNKVGQYSKYLNLTPTFVTYLAVNQIHSRADTGTGTVMSETGYNSPLRFNKIIGLPVYNMPILSPDIIYDETGADLELDLSDITLLPNTVKPTVPDYMHVVTPDGTEVLFRVNRFKYNTIQSNEFVTIDLELKGVGKDLLSRFDGQIIKTYYTVFDNIGTEDKCFIEEENIQGLNTLVDGIEECIDLYQNMYWNPQVGAYLLPSQTDTNRVIYDAFLTHFINNLDLFPHNSSKITTMPYMDFNPHGSELKYRRSLLYAVETQSSKFLYDKMYYYLGVISNPASPLRVYHYDAYSVKLVMLEKNEPMKSDLIPYYDYLVIRGILNGDVGYPKRPEFELDTELPEMEQAKPGIPSTRPGTESNPDFELTPELPEMEQVMPGLGIKSAEEYMNEQIARTIVGGHRPGIVPYPNKKTKRKPLILSEFDAPILENKEYIELTEEDYEHIDSYTEDQKYVLDLVIKFMSDSVDNVDIKSLIDALITPSRFSYFYGPIVVRILKDMYDNYFSSAQDNEEGDNVA